MLAVWVPELPFQLARQGEPGLAGRPIGFRSPDPGRTPTLWMVDRIARKAGLKPGIPVDIALHQDPGLVVLDPAPSTWVDARACLGQHLLAYSPLGRLGRFGEGFVDLLGTERLHGPALDAAEHLRTGLRAELGWSAHGGLSQSFSASRLAAKAEDQVRLIEAGQEAPFLAPFPIGALTALEARSRERLQHFGLHRVAQVQPMEIDALGRIIPPTEAFRVLRQARGEDQDRLPPLEVVQASETLRKIIMPPAHRHDLGVASWAWEAAWAWRLDGRFLHRLRLSWWDMDDLHHTLAFRMGGEDLWTCCRALELKFMAEATRRVLIQRMELEAWLQAVMASRWLTRLYRTLRDDHQAATAIQAGAPAEERLKRLGLHGRVSSMDVLFNQDHPEEIQAEEAAWTALIEGHAGLSAFFAITDSTDGKPSPGLRGPRNATFGAFRKAIQGFHTAFPNSTVTKGVALATQTVTKTCVEAFLASVEEGDPDQREHLRVALEACVLEALNKAVTE